MPKVPRHIEILTFPRAQVLDITGPLQVFATANDLAAIERSALPYATRVVASEDRVTTSAGLALVTERLPGAERPLDTLIVAGGYGIQAACDSPALVEWLRERAGAARRVASVCSGAFLLATAGLLDGRRAVTHWGRCAEFAQRFPAVRLDPDPIFIRDGHVWTSAGVTAGIDLALALVEADLGRETALAVARQLVVFLKRPGGQSQFSTTLALQERGERFDELHAWIVENLRSDLSLEQLAAQTNMSLRSFARHYRVATGRTPARAVEEIRLETARQLLDQGHPVARVAGRCGFGSEETLRRAFLRRLGTTPQAYRARFAG